jgi:quercetin dioxygenase-like cupin family protein
LQEIVMTLIKATASPTFELPPFLSVTGGAAPSRGAQETCVWRLTLAPGAPPVPHAVDREEIFVALTGQAEAQVGDERCALEAGDTLIVPAGQTFSLANPGSADFVAVTVLPVGGRACMSDGAAFVPPWAQ